MTTSDEKKEKVIHTRISESLDDEIKRKATRLGISVSNLVRNVLLNTFGLVEDIVADSANIAQSARGETAARPSPPEPPQDASPRSGVTVLGWQDVVLNVNAVCDSCNAILKKGTPAAIAVTAEPGAKMIVCKVCLEKSMREEE